MIVSDEKDQTVQPTLIPREPLPGLRVATLNTWNGLNGKGRLQFGVLETRAERMERLQRQVSLLKDLDADVILLQEVNPLPFRAHWYAVQLDKKEYNVTSNSGIKLGWGPPYNLNEGLCVLVPHGWRCEFLGKFKLSGQLSFYPFRVSQVRSPYLSLQFHEARVATAMRLWIPEDRVSGHPGKTKSILIATAHLHHPPSLSLSNQELWQNEIRSGLSADEVVFLESEFRKSNSRRTKEMDSLGVWLQGLRKAGESMILGGDFNCEEGSDPYKSLVRKGWSDLWSLGVSGGPEATWDPGLNPFAARSLNFHFKAGTFNERVETALHWLDFSPRRIDHLFAYPPSESAEVNSDTLWGALGNLKGIQRFGGPEESLDRSKSSRGPVSDHYGVVAQFQPVD